MVAASVGKATNQSRAVPSLDGPKADTQPNVMCLLDGPVTGLVEVSSVRQSPLISFQEQYYKIRERQTLKDTVSLHKPQLPSITNPRQVLLLPLNYPTHNIWIPFTKLLLMSMGRTVNHFSGGTPMTPRFPLRWQYRTSCRKMCAKVIS